MWICALVEYYAAYQEDLRVATMTCLPMIDEEIRARKASPRLATPSERSAMAAQVYPALLPDEIFVYDQVLPNQPAAVGTNPAKEKTHE